MLAMPTFIPVGDYSNAERMLAIPTFTPLFTTTKFRAGGGSKNGAACNAEKVDVKMYSGGGHGDGSSVSLKDHA